MYESKNMRLFFRRYIDGYIVVVLFVIEMHDCNHIQFLRMREKSIECELSNIQN
jgi:hypothetical protein